MGLLAGEHVGVPDLSAGGRDRLVPLRMALGAMATRFELVAAEGAEPVRTRAACEAALEELRDAERTLSAFRRDALPARLERAAAASGSATVRLSREETALLELCRRAAARSDGAFDPALGAGSLSRWRIDRRARSVELQGGAPRLDLGGVGKGHALDLAVRALREAGVGCALLHGGTSSVAALGAPPEAEAWRVRIRHPQDEARPLATVQLRDRSLSVSATHGRTREPGARHVIDPRDGTPVERARLAAVSARHGATAEIASTALLVRAERCLRRGAAIERASLGVARSSTFLLAWEEEGRLRCMTSGPEAACFTVESEP